MRNDRTKESWIDRAHYLRLLATQYLWTGRVPITRDLIILANDIEHADKLTSQPNVISIFKF